MDPEPARPQAERLPAHVRAGRRELGSPASAGRAQVASRGVSAAAAIVAPVGALASGRMMRAESPPCMCDGRDSKVGSTNPAHVYGESGRRLGAAVPDFNKDIV